MFEIRWVVMDPQLPKNKYLQYRNSPEEPWKIVPTIVEESWRKWPNEVTAQKPKNSTILPFKE
jgi:hypothetical protein